MLQKRQIHETDFNNAKQNETCIPVFASSTVDVLLTHFLSSPTTDANRRESGSRGRWVLGTRRGGALGGGRRWRRGGEVGVEVLLVRGALGGGRR